MYLRSTITLFVGCLLVACMRLSAKDETTTQSTQATTAALQAEHACNIQMSALVDEFQYLQHVWLKQENSPYHIGSNFEALLKRHETYFTQVEGYVAGVPTEATDRGELETAIRNLDKRHSELMSELAISLRGDTLFLLSINTLENKLGNLQARFAQLTGCNDNLLAERGSLGKEIDAWKAELVRLRLYVAEAQDKRRKVFDLARDTLRVELERKWAASASADLQTIHKQIDAILRADRLLWAVHNWYRAFANDSALTVTIHQHLQYEKPLAQLIVVEEQGKAFRSEGQALGLPEMTNGEMLRQIDAYLKTIQELRTTLESRGWRGTFDRQRLLNSKRMTMLDRLGPRCESTILAYNSRANSVTTAGEFEEVAPLYAHVYENCKLKEVAP